MDTVLACIARDRADGLIDRWSLSTVIDENIGEAVVERDVFERIHGASGVNARFPIGNAGLVHVYGYLFSTVVTPYGYKSDRWNASATATRRRFRGFSDPRSRCCGSPRRARTSPSGTPTACVSAPS
jgi:hypothetical protein